MTDSSPRESLQEWAKAGASKVTLALVFTDIVDSTFIGGAMGDDKWIELLMRHFRRARLLTEQYDCYEIKVIGDSFMVAFRTAYDALKFAMEFYEDTGDPQIKIRAGIHLGQVRIIENDIYGRMVNYTSRVEHSIQRAGIALSAFAHNDVTNELGSQSKDVLFRPYTATMKGFPSPQMLWQVITPDMSAANVERHELLTQSENETEDDTADGREFGDHDRALFYKFINDFPSQGRSAIFLREHDIGGSFRSSDLTDIYNFLRVWNDAEHEFNNVELEKKRKALRDALHVFTRELGEHAFTTHIEGRLSIGTRDFETRREMLDLQERLNDLATKAYEAHQDLIREGRRYL